MSRVATAVKWILWTLLGVICVSLVLGGMFSLRFILAVDSCSKSNEHRASLTEGRTELNLDYYGADQDKLKLIDGGVYEIPGIDIEDIVCSTVYWFGQPSGKPLNILLTPDSDIKEPVLDLSGKRLTVRAVDAPTEYAELIKAAMKGDRHQGIEWSDKASLRIYLGENGSFYFQSAIYLYEKADGSGRAYFVQGANGLYYELTDTEGLYDWLDTNVFVS